jgi:hypothetical protein
MERHTPLTQPCTTRLQLPPRQVQNHLSPRDPRRPPQGREVQGAGEGIGIAKAQHGGDPAAGVLEREARFVHLVLLDRPAPQVVHAALRIHFGLVRPRRVRQLRARQDVEVVVGCVPPRVALGADGGSCVC